MKDVKTIRWTPTGMYKPVPGYGTTVMAWMQGSSVFNLMDFLKLHKVPNHILPPRSYLHLVLMNSGKDIEVPHVAYDEHLVIPPEEMHLGVYEYRHTNILSLNIHNMRLIKRMDSLSRKYGCRPRVMPHITLSYNVPANYVPPTEIDFPIVLVGEKVTGNGSKTQFEEINILDSRTAQDKRIDAEWYRQRKTRVAELMK